MEAVATENKVHDKMGLDTQDFIGGGGNLNLEGMANLEKGYISERAFTELYAKSGKYELFAKAALIEKANSMADDIEKGEGVTEGHIDFSKVKRMVIRREDHTDSEIFVLEKAVEATSDNIEKAEDGTPIEKSLMGYGKNNLTFKKTGKEIKDKLAGVKSKLTTKIAEYVAKMAVLKGEIGIEPTQEMNKYEYQGKEDKVGKMMRYPYEMEYYNDKSMAHNMMTTDTVNYSSKGATSKDMATKVREYNDLAYSTIRCKLDEIEADLYITNLDDKKSFELTADQAMKLDF